MLNFETVNPSKPKSVQAYETIQEKGIHPISNHYNRNRTHVSSNPELAKALKEVAKSLPRSLSWTTGPSSASS
jgi:hypothetical protein